MEESVVAQQFTTLMAQDNLEGTVDSEPQEKYELEAKCETPDEGTEVESKTEQTIQTESTNINQALLEVKISELEALLATEREQTQELEAAVASLEQQIEGLREKDQSLTASLQQSLQVVQEAILEESSERRLSSKSCAGAARLRKTTWKSV